MGQGPSRWRFSTDGIPASERLAYFREVVGRSLARVEFSPVEGHPLKWAVDVHSFDGLVVVSAENSAIRSHRAPSLLSDGNDDLIFVISRTGYSLASQLGRDCRIGGPAVSVLSNAEPGTNDYPIPTSSLHLRIPRRRLAALVGTPEDAVTRPIPADCEPVRLLLDYVDLALRQDRLTTPQLQQLFTTHVQDLVALAIGAAGDPAEVASGRGLAAARLNAAKADISRRLDEDRMAIADVAGRLGVTPRYVQMLFEAEGTRSPNTSWRSALRGLTGFSPTPVSFTNRLRRSPSMSASGISPISIASSGRNTGRRRPRFVGRPSAQPSRRSLRRRRLATFATIDLLRREVGIALQRSCRGAEGHVDPAQRSRPLIRKVTSCRPPAPVWTARPVRPEATAWMTAPGNGAFRRMTCRHPSGCLIFAKSLADRGAGSS